METIFKLHIQANGKFPSPRARATSALNKDLFNVRFYSYFQKIKVLILKKCIGINEYLKENILKHHLKLPLSNISVDNSELLALFSELCTREP